MEQIESYIGSVCEVENAQNDLLLHGRLNAVFPFNGCTLEIVSLDHSPLMRCEKGTAVKLHVYSNTLGPFFLNGRVVVGDTNCWQISDVSPVSKEERRGFFRIKIESPAAVHAVSGATFPARAINISLAGVMFTSRAHYEVGDEIVLHNLCIGRDPIPFAIRCRVARMGTASETGTQYGCAFLKIAQSESDRLCQAIFEVQHQAVRCRRAARA